MKALSRQTTGVWPWVILFLVWNVVFWQRGNPNPGSRLAALSAMTESGHFVIDDYVNSPTAWTEDWSHPPDGHFYSNKAPGPILLAYPIFRLVDRWVIQGTTSSSERFLARRRHLVIYNYVLSIVVQTIPFALLVAFWCYGRQQNNFSLEALTFSLIAAFFGNTASVLMNTFFGHGLAAIFIVGAAISLEKERWIPLGLCVGAAALCDYTMVLALVAAAVSLIISRVSFSAVIRFATGLIGPLFVWGWYHNTCFGHPWLSAIAFQNPCFVDIPRAHAVLWGVWSAIPHPAIVAQLLLGPSRGILFTQPWLLLFFPFIIVYAIRCPDKKLAAVFHFCWIGLLLTLLFNAGFGGWHGGDMIGPRYLSPFFPLAALLTVYLFDDHDAVFHRLAWGCLAISVLLVALIFASTPFAPPGAPLWPYLCRVLIDQPSGFGRLLFGALSFALVFWWTITHREHA